MLKELKERVERSYFDNRPNNLPQVKILTREVYYLGDEIHRENGPAITNFLKNGRKYGEYYCIHNKFHREDGPAYIIYYENGTKSETYYLYGHIVDELILKVSDPIKFSKAYKKFCSNYSEYHNNETYPGTIEQIILLAAIKNKK